MEQEREKEAILMRLARKSRARPAEYNARQALERTAISFDCTTSAKRLQVRFCPVINLRLSECT